MAQMNAAAGGPPSQVPQPNLNVSTPMTGPAGTTPTPPPGPPAATPAPAGAQPTAVPGSPGNVRLILNSPGPVKNGGTFQIPVVISGGADVTAVPLQMQYDPAKLSLVNVGPGDFLSGDGQSVAETHRDDGPGNLSLNISRPRGSIGMNGAGVVCVLTFQAKEAGNTTLSITRAGATTSAGQSLTVQGSQASVNIQ
jgi:general secretion pathway protein D